MSLSSLESPVDFEFIKHQKGMFTLLGLSPAEVQLLIDKHAVYMIPSGRINIAGLN